MVRIALLLGLVGCSSPARPEPKPAPKPPAPRPVRAEPEPLPATDCRGSELDLHAISLRELCPIGELAPPGSLVASIPAQTKTTADFDWIAVELRNESDRPVTAAINPRMLEAIQGPIGDKVSKSSIGYVVTVEPGGVARLRARCQGRCLATGSRDTRFDVHFFGALATIVGKSTVSGSIALETPVARVDKPTVSGPQPDPAPPRVVSSDELLPLLVAGDKNPAPDSRTAATMRKQSRRAIAAFKVCIDAAGQVVESTKLRASAYPTYDLIVEAAIGKWLFKPFEVDRKPAPVCAAVTFIQDARK
jgi:hypothetical protein